MAVTIVVATSAARAGIASGAAGRYFYELDTELWYRSNGSAWVLQNAPPTGLDSIPRMHQHAGVDLVGPLPIGGIPAHASTHDLDTGTDPIADLPLGTEKAALAGTSGSPSTSNRYVTNADSRLTDARTPTGTAGGDLVNTYPNPQVANAAGRFGLSSLLSPSQITADQSDYNPTGLGGAGMLRLSTDASRTITGLSGGSVGRLIFVANVGSQDLVLSNENVSSAASNRFGFGADVTLKPSRCCAVFYDSVASRWRCVAVSKLPLVAADIPAHVSTHEYGGSDVLALSNIGSSFPTGAIPFASAIGGKLSADATALAIDPTTKKLNVNVGSGLGIPPAQTSVITTINQLGGVTAGDASFVITSGTNFPLGGATVVASGVIFTYASRSGTTLSGCVGTPAIPNGGAIGIASGQAELTLQDTTGVNSMRLEAVGGGNAGVVGLRSVLSSGERRRVNSNSVLVIVEGVGGYAADGSTKASYSAATSGGAVSVVSTETYTETARGGAIQFLLTPTGTTTRAALAGIFNDGRIWTRAGQAAVTIANGEPTAGYVVHGGRRSQNITIVGNTHTDGVTFDDLGSLSIDASMLARDGDEIVVYGNGDFAGSANSKDLRICCAGTSGTNVLYDTSGVAFNGATWRARIRVVRLSSTTFLSEVDFESSSSLLATATKVQSSVTISGGGNWGGAQTFKFQGVSSGIGAAANDVRQFNMAVDLRPAP